MNFENEAIFAGDAMALDNFGNLLGQFSQAGQLPRVRTNTNVRDQLAMSRLPRATFALLLSLLPASATVIGIVVLGQIPKPIEIVGILLVAGGVALHQEAN